MRSPKGFTIFSDKEIPNFEWINTHSEPFEKKLNVSLREESITGQVVIIIS